MELLRFPNVRRDIGHHTVLADVSFRINAGERVGMAWIEDCLRAFRGAVLVVSHNRYRMERIAAEREKMDLEHRVSEAFTRGDHREGTRAATVLERHRGRLDESYARWLAEEG